MWPNVVCCDSLHLSSLGLYLRPIFPNAWVPPPKRNSHLPWRLLGLLLNCEPSCSVTRKNMARRTDIRYIRPSTFITNGWTCSSVRLVNGCQWRLYNVTHPLLRLRVLVASVLSLCLIMTTNHRRVRRTCRWHWRRAPRADIYAEPTEPQPASWRLGRP
ncbi:hypothetical protein GY45DRAFT_418518 [Cubamyces sp. BRFM 1775]|nr:hypothetical protein GY45DRAFT_418518 [Cubamyces sp. BRFM 1775]